MREHDPKRNAAAHAEWNGREMSVEAKVFTADAVDGLALFRRVNVQSDAKPDTEQTSVDGRKECHQCAKKH